jgi:hypothetical protein
VARLLLVEVAASLSFLREVKTTDVEAEPRAPTDRFLFPDYMQPHVQAVRQTDRHTNIQMKRKRERVSVGERVS